MHVLHLFFILKLVFFFLFSTFFHVLFDLLSGLFARAGGSIPIADCSCRLSIFDSICRCYLIADSFKNCATTRAHPCVSWTMDQSRNRPEKIAHSTHDREARANAPPLARHSRALARVLCHSRKAAFLRAWRTTFVREYLPEPRQQMFYTSPCKSVHSQVRASPYN